ncbi:MAG: MFS transporter, partial [Myxococcota bacterium]
SLAGFAVLIALCFDAVTDPLAGSISDRFRSRWGRRHPFMYASAVPLAVTFYLLFTPPGGLGQWGLCAWLSVFAVLVRGSMTLYHVPHLALGAELSDDYHERTGIVGYRTIFGLLGGVSTATLGFFYFFRATPQFAQGTQNPEAYPAFALFFGAAMLLTILYSAAGTHSRIPTLRKPPPDPVPFSFRRLYQEMSGALSNPSFRALFIGVVIFFVMRGVQLTLGLHMNIHFWALDSRLIGWLILTILAGVVLGVPFWTRASRGLDKKPTFLIGVGVFTTLVFLPPLLKIAGLWPPIEQFGLYFGLLAGMGFVAAFGAAGALVTAGSMMADITDEQELVTGVRQEGILFGALAFAGKSASGIGHQVAGFGIDLIGFPTNAVPGEVPLDIIRNLGILYGPGLLVLGLISFVFLARYRLDHKRVAEIQEELGRPRAA